MGHLPFCQTWKSSKGINEQTRAGGKWLDIEEEHVESRPGRARNFMAFIVKAPESQISRGFGFLIGRMGKE